MRQVFTALVLIAVTGTGAAAQTSSSVWDGIYTEAQAARGGAVFTARCAICHGASLDGSGEAPALAGPQFLSEFNGLTVGDVFDRIRISMPQDNPGSLSREQYADILAFILKSNDMAPGTKELDSRSEYLKAIAFDAANPHPAAHPPQLRPADPAALEAADKASGVLSGAANDPRNAPNSQPDPYVADTNFFKLPPGRRMGSSSTVAVDSKGHIWVAERCGANDCAGSNLDPVMEFDSKGNFIKSFGAHRLLFPHGIFIDRADHVWLADGHVGNGIGNDVLEFGQDGKVLMTLGTPGASGNDAKTFNEPNAVLVAPNGNIFVTDGHDAGPGHNARVMKFDSKGKFIKQWGGHGMAGGQFDVPHTMAMDTQGHLYVGDRWNNRIQEFDQDGGLLRIFTQFGRPSGIYIDKHDILYATDSESRAPLIYGYHPGWKRGIRIGSVHDGIVTAFIPDTDPNPDAGSTSGGEGIGADDNGVVYGAQVEQKAIVRYVKK